MNPITLITSVIGSATIIFRILLIVAKLTGAKSDILLKIFEKTSLNVGKIQNIIIVKAIRGKQKWKQRKY